ncbi:ATP-grasp domain-containing protein [Sporosarcina pasteurii]|uniref:Carbamoyl phosphate synthase-like protein n=1 Tax=Sporosarcina pasteurii TaxID=1474 RepID=A0A380CBF0_SPOPA|nr:ATP-grasp domain-containing protein [Sporosarcina pasteurii]MDS9473087.1 ATP-grasp domain-containing protein [Sporosarcina pasteurii]QBQ04262.1 ATP-grasp domain-containing protein [Sporosarcina pasteurii]SUJ17003.1 carbamoyl phosphate synthase-like protein [Sporosarcina pasteurii]
MTVGNEIFVPVLLGSDMNAYGMARSFHEAYGIKSLVLGRATLTATANSNIIEIREIPKLNEQDVFLPAILKIAEEYKDRKLLLLACGDDYAKLIINNKEKLTQHFAIPYIDKSLMERLVLKENFYEICEQYNFAYPKTTLCTYENKDTFEMNFDYPIIIKASNSVAYWNCSFPGKKKVFVAHDEAEKKAIIDAIYSSTYKDNLTIQEFIPGDDSYMRVLNAYVGKDGKVKLMSLGNPILEEHSPEGIGSYAAIINTFDKELLDKVRIFLEDIGYTGFANFDMKYDERDGQYKLFEINLRNGRSSYYVSASGHNLMKYVTEDHIYDKELPLTYAKDEHLWLIIPKGVLFKYTQNATLKRKAKQLIAAGKSTNSLFYNKDFNIVRWIKLTLNRLNYYRKYKKYFNNKGLS